MQKFAIDLFQRICLVESLAYMSLMKDKTVVTESDLFNSVIKLIPQFGKQFSGVRSDGYVLDSSKTLKCLGTPGYEAQRLSSPTRAEIAAIAKSGTATFPCFVAEISCAASPSGVHFINVVLDDSGNVIVEHDGLNTYKKGDCVPLKTLLTLRAYA